MFRYFFIFTAVVVICISSAAQVYGQTVSGVLRVVIDPGHGGEDKGVTGSAGLSESRLTMALARQLKVVLEDKLRARVFLTRKDNQNPSLDERTSVVNRVQARIFLSLHASGINDRTRSGFSVFYQDYSLQQGLANRVTLVVPEPHKIVEWDLAQGPYIIQSRRLGGELDQALKTALKVKGNFLTGLPLALLAGAARPAVLVEVGYLTNPEEERRLMSQPYRDAIVRGIVRGISSYDEWVRRRLSGQ